MDKPELYVPKVYITNYNYAFDYTGAEGFGEPIFMTQGVVPNQHLLQKLDIFRKFAAQSSPEDYLLLSGSNVLCAMATIAWAEVHGSVNILSHAPRS